VGFGMLQAAQRYRARCVAAPLATRPRKQETLLTRVNPPRSIAFLNFKESPYGLQTDC
jgi:hypothetical protein